MTADLALTLFRANLAAGMTHAEAATLFTPDDLRTALFSEEFAPPEAHELLNLLGKAQREEMNDRDMDQAIELWLAGWKSETPHKTQTDVMSWYWRRPARTKTRPGRLFLSTNQAFSAMKKGAKL